MLSITTSTPSCVSIPSSSPSSSSPSPLQTRPLAVSVASSSNGFESIVAGIIAGCVTRSCTSPLDVLKIIIQVNGPSGSTCVAVPLSGRPGIASRYQTLARLSSTSSISRTVRHLYGSEGVRGFWKGNLAGCCRLGPYAGAKFFLYDTLQARFLGDAPTNVQRALCGATAGLLATMGTYPMEVVRTRMITQTAATPRYLRIHGVSHGVSVIRRHEGLRGLYKGGLSGIVGAIPFEGVQFGCYEYLKHTTQANHWPACRWPEGKQDLDGVDFFACGSIAGAIAQTVAYPFDTVKKRLQTQRCVHYRGMVDCFRKVIREEGLLALYRGTVPNLARVVPYAAVMFSTYELTKKTLRLLSESEAASPTC